jgi:hypothetical protein
MRRQTDSEPIGGDFSYPGNFWGQAWQLDIYCSLHAPQVRADQCQSHRFHIGSDD